MRRGALAALLGLALAACGRVGPPVPPETRLPVAVADLRAVVRDGAVELTWTNPTRRADGSKLTLDVARVFRHEASADAPEKPALLSRGRVAGYAEIATIPLGGPPGTTPGAPGGAEALVEGARVTLRDRQGLVHGNRYTYVVTVHDLQGRSSPPSERRSVAFIAPPEAPSLTVEPLDASVRLTWRPPSRLVDGSPIAGDIVYEVLRAPDATAPLVPVTPAPIAGTEHVDRGLENERTYHYAVRALRRDRDTTAAGPPSARVAATPVDMTPPAPPGRLVAVVAGRTVRLSWTPSPDADVARYVVHRAAAGQAPVRVGSVQAPTASFVDRDVPSGTHRYTVTAVDAGSRANESAPSNEVSVAVP